MTAVAVNTLTTWVETVRAKLETELRATYGGNFEVVHAQLVGPYEDRDIACIWVEKAEIEAETASQALDVRVRVFRQWSLVEPHGLDPAQLEVIPDIVNNALTAIQVGAGIWFFSIQGFQIDHESWGTEVVILARRENPFLP